MNQRKIQNELGLSSAREQRSAQTKMGLCLKDRDQLEGAPTLKGPNLGQIENRKENEW